MLMRCSTISVPPGVASSRLRRRVRGAGEPVRPAGLPALASVKAEKRRWDAKSIARLFRGRSEVASATLGSWKCPTRRTPGTEGRCGGALGGRHSPVGPGRRFSPFWFRVGGIHKCCASKLSAASVNTCCKPPSHPDLPKLSIKTFNNSGNSLIRCRFPSRPRSAERVRS